MGRIAPAAAAALVATGVAWAAGVAVTDKVRIAGSNTTKAFAPTSYVVVTSPPELDRRTGFDGDSGGWEGPMCESGNALRPTIMALTWSVVFRRGGGAEAAARARLTFNWATVEQGAIAVRHVVAGRRVGTIPGFYAVTDSRSDQGYHQSAVGVPLGRGVFAAADFWSRGNSGECIVLAASGPMPVATWHRTKAREAVSLVELEGNLPPARVTARGAPGRVTGRVTDAFGHPDANAVVRLQRRSGGRWRAAGSARTTAGGTYSIRSGARGTLRVVAVVGPASATSRSFRR